MTNVAQALKQRVSGAIEHIAETAEGPAQEAEVVLEEEIEASLNPDRARHDELGRIEEAADQIDRPDAEPSPREQPAAPIDIAKVDE
jgi:hypothetical protein